MPLTAADLPGILEAIRSLRAVIASTPPDPYSPAWWAHTPLGRDALNLLKRRLCPSAPATPQHNPDLYLDRGTLPPRLVCELRKVWEPLTRLVWESLALPWPSDIDPWLVRLEQAEAELVEVICPEPPERLTFDRESRTVTLDGTPYPRLDPTAFDLLETIWTLQQEEVRRGRPGVVSGPDLLLCRRLKGKNIPREIKKLPEGLQEIIKGGPGSGRWVALPPRNCL
jgi:hypothetical protein